MKIVLLGTGTPNAEPWASFPAYALIHKEKVFLIDCGPGVMRAYTKAFYEGLSECKPKNLNTIFITHLHSDHTAGLGEAILIPWVLDRTEPIHIYGPKGIQHMVDHILLAYEEDTKIRNDGLEPIETKGKDIIVHEINEGLIYGEDGLKIKSLQVKHGSLEAYAYCFEADGHKVVFSGDTKALEEMKDFAKDADLLIHEVEYTKGLQERTPEWQAYHKEMHTMSIELADIINVAKPKKTITTHRILHLDYYNNGPISKEEIKKREDALLKEITDRTDCIVCNGYDGDVFEI